MPAILTKTHPFVCAFALLSVVAPGQAQPQRPFVRALGEATVSVKPDESRVQFSVVTQATTAQEAADRNATQVNAVLAALRSVLGPNADLKTLSYSLFANYNNQSVLTGYTATNTVEVTLTDLSVIGKIIDTGIQAGANRVQGLQFGLKDDQPVRAQALKLATAQAKTHADAMASGVGLKTGAVISIQEGATVRPVVQVGVAAPTATTPVETGLVDVHATVTLEVEITP
jgi:uncharacterized protein YggE